MLTRLMLRQALHLLQSLYLALALLFHLPGAGVFDPNICVLRQFNDPLAEVVVTVATISRKQQGMGVPGACFKRCQSGVVHIAPASTAAVESPPGSIRRLDER